MMNQELSPSVSAYEELQAYAFNQGLTAEESIQMVEAALGRVGEVSKPLAQEDRQLFQDELEVNKDSREKVREIYTSLSLSEDGLFRIIVALMEFYSDLKDKT